MIECPDGLAVADKNGNPQKVIEADLACLVGQAGQNGATPPLLDLTSAQTITGVKTFNGQTNLEGVVMFTANRSYTDAPGNWYNNSQTNCAGGMTVGGNGNSVLKKFMAYAPNLNPVAVAANTTAEQTFAVAGLAVTDKVVINGPAPTAGTGIVNARVSAAGTLALTFSNNTAGALTPTAGTYAILAFGT